jgi:hypothetical protein
MKVTEEQLPYRVYVLRSWQERGPTSGTPAVWRFSLEDATTRQRRGFENLEALMNFLVAETHKGPFQELSNHGQTERREA